MRLFIAEKPSLGRAIAEGLGGGSPQEGCIRCGADTVTWCFGHILELFYPEDYTPAWKQWSRATLPIIPDAWKMKPRADAQKQLSIIKGLLKEADCVVHAGDPDREGQLLIDEVLEYLNYKGSVQRIWLASLDAQSVAKALNNLTNNLDYAPLRDAARARSQADWLVGLNATRAMTMLGKSSGYTEVLSLGRVQTPTLSLVVDRDMAIAQFQPIDYFVLQATMEHPNGVFKARFQPSEIQTGLDSEGRLIDEKVVSAILSDIMSSCFNQQGRITEVSCEKKRKAPPLPHCLSSLQKAASARWGMSAQAVLSTAQALYEKKLTTYPRSDCRYLPEEQFSDAVRILKALHQVHDMTTIAQNADSSLRGAVWNTKKITAHHAIIPTGEVPGQLSIAEKNIYSMIATSYCLQFFPPLEYETQKIHIEIAGNTATTAWLATGRRILKQGWKSATNQEDEDDAKEKEPTQILPSVVQGDSVTVQTTEALAKKTTPPAKFSEGTLIEAMANIHRFVADTTAKHTLKENEGLGTEATRANIIETLKKRGYLVVEKKSIVSTPLGQEIISLTPNELKNPITTAQWESRLSDIAYGKESLQTFMKAQEDVLPTLLEPLLSATPKQSTTMHRCPSCGHALLRQKGKQGFFWGCSCYPECKTTLSDSNGKPCPKNTPRHTPAENIPPCPQCGGILKYFKSKKGDMLFGCFEEKKHCNKKPLFWKAKNGRPQFT